MASFRPLFNPVNGAIFLQNTTPADAGFLRHVCRKRQVSAVKSTNRRKKHHSGDEPRCCHKKPLTAQAQYGLMRPVARIAQSVEQGIENPCVLGSIPSPGTIFRRPRLWRVFCFLRYGLSIELRSMTRLNRLALRANGKAVVQTPAALVRVRAPYLEEPAYGGFFAFCDTDSPSNSVR